jgi:hypothetical protein
MRLWRFLKRLLRRSEKWDDDLAILTEEEWELWMKATNGDEKKERV